LPKDTFFNLPEEKRNAIIDAALREFAAYPYDQASVNRVVAATGIAKGSFYQYFADKKDLYKYLLGQMVEAKVKYLKPVMQNPFELPFFTVVRELNRAGLAFAKEHPLFMQVGRHFLRDKNHPVVLEVVSENKKTGANVYELLLRRAMDKGEVRPDLDVAFTATLMFNLSTQLVEQDLDLENDKWLEKMCIKLDQLIDLFANGMRSDVKGAE